jgi:uncharacterized membrane protein
MRLLRLLKYDLAKESNSWVNDGIISEKQAEAICSYYGINYHDQLKYSYGYYVLVILGCLFIGLSLITLVGANWEDIPRAVRMLGLVSITLSLNSFALYQFRQGNEKAAVGWFFLGGLCYGASIMLIAQIYHIGEHFPDGIFWWALGILPLALILRSNLLMLLTIMLAFIWFFVESGLNYYPVFFFVFMAALAWHVFRMRQSNILFLALVVGIVTLAEYSMSWGLDEMYRFGFGPENMVLGVALFLVFYALSKWFASVDDHKMVDYGALLGVWTLRFAIVSLFVFSFEEPWREIIQAEWERTQLAIVISFMAVIASILFTYYVSRNIVSITAFSLFYLCSLFVVMRLDPTASGLLQVFDNLMLVATGVWLIVLGIRNGISHYYYLGVSTVLGAGFLRYIDFVGDYIGAAILFAVFAAILLVTARYWKSNQASEESSS